MFTAAVSDYSSAYSLQKQIQRSLLHVLGLAVSNSRFVGPKFGACHMLNLGELTAICSQLEKVAFLTHFDSRLLSKYSFATSTCS